MKKSLLFVALSILFLPVFNIAQEDTKKEENPLSIPETVPATYPVVSPPILLPEKPDSWAISVHTEGGIMGIKYLVLALNSEGKYQCGEKGEVKDLGLNNESFLEIKKLAKTFQTSFYSKYLSEKSNYCNDCLYNSISLYLTAKTENTSEAKKDETSQLLPEVPSLQFFYRKVFETVDCKIEAKKDSQNTNQ